MHESIYHCREDTTTYRIGRLLGNTSNLWERLNMIWFEVK
jgi:hypothetical protein